MFKYDITVIIPVYNSAEYLRACINSLLAQTHPFERIEVFIVNDGSTDNSEEIINDYVKKYTNVIAVSQKNSGVSAARNQGLKNASGKYIFFLDADDRLSDNAVHDLFKFFEAHFDETDIVSCSIMKDSKGVMTQHPRNALIKETKVYDVNEEIYLAQTNINVCVKNLREETILFDTSMELGEDENRNNQIIMQKKKIGYCKEAVYYYTHHADSVSQSKNHAYYTFDKFMNYYESLFSTYRDDNGIHPYIQAIVLYGITWRVKWDLLFPYHLDGPQKADAYDRISSLLKNIDNRIIINSPHVEYFHRLFYLRLKNENNIRLLNNREGFAVCAEDGTLCYLGKAFKINITKILIRQQKLIVAGYTFSPLAEIQEPKLYARDKNGKHNIALSKSVFSSYKSKIATNNFYSFECSLPLSNVYNVSFFAEMEGCTFPVELAFSDKAQINNKRPFILQEGYTVRQNTNKSALSIKKVNKKEAILTGLALDKLHFKLSKKIFLYRKLTLIKFKRKIWLYCDRKDIFDNAYLQFKHDLLKNDGIDRYYIVDGLKNANELFTKDEQKRLVRFKSLKHKMLFLNCNNILTSFTSLSILSPFDAQPLRWYSDLLKYEVVYLQHGVLHAHLPAMYSKESSGCDKIVVSSQFEIDNFIKSYGYKKEDLILSGMPRYDKVNLKAEPGNKILFSPSWRNNLIGAYINNTRKLNRKAFENSIFFKQISLFLNSKELGEYLEKYDVLLEFKNHPIFEGYNECFKITNARVKIIQGEAKVDEYLAMVTDFSSIVFDFVYLERPVIYFVPDYDLFKAGVTHNYRELDIPLENGFGVFTRTSDELIIELNRLAENNFMPENEYALKMRNFFLTKEANHSDLLYEIMNKN